jgi:hypothetical protein
MKCKKWYISQIVINSTNNEEGINHCHQQDTYSDDTFYVEI